MPSYTYKAINARGSKIKGTMTADNPIELETKIAKLGLDLLNFKEVKQKTMLPFLGRIKPKELIMFCIHMEQLEKAGVPILDAVADMRDTSDNMKMQDVMGKIHESLKGGKLLSEALGEHPRVFDDTFVGLIAAGERTGDMAASFGHLAHHLKWQEDLKRKVKKATRYPIILIFILSGVISLMMMFVVPKMSDFLKNQGFDLPFYTIWLIAVSDAFVNYWYLMFGVPIALFILVTFLYRVSDDFAYNMDAIVLKIPKIGEVMRKIELSRFSQFFMVTFVSGIDMIECMETSERVVHNRVVKEAIFLAKQAVSEGNQLTDALRISNQFPNLVIRMFKVGEDSGEMQNALENISFFYDREVNDAVDAMVEMIQPTMTVVLGGIMFWIIVAVFGPLYASFEKIKF